MHACAYKTAKRHNENRKHQININQGVWKWRHHQVVVRVQPKQQQLNYLSSETESCRCTGGSESERDGEKKGFLPVHPAAKSSLKTLNTRWLMRLKNILCTGEPERSMQCWGVRSRDAWMRYRHFHCNCLNCCSLLLQEHTLGGWQSQFCSSHRSSTQAWSLDRIQGTLGDQEKD